MHYLAELKQKLNDITEVLTIETGQNPFTVTPIRCANNEVIGVNVSNLGKSPYLPIDVFVAVISLLILNDGQADKGQARNHRVGNVTMHKKSVEGHVAQVCYGIDVGAYATARITPIEQILFWAEVIEDPRGNGYLKLVP